MSEYGLQVFNSTGDLCLAVLDNAAHLHYLGTATYIEDTNGPPGWGLGSDNRCTRYQVSSPGGPPLVFVRLPTGAGRFAIRSVSLASGATYDIYLWDSTGEPNTRTRPTLDCFGYLTTNTPASDYGLQVFNASGAVVTDTTRNPLISGRVYTQAATTGSNSSVAPELSIDLSGLGTPAINFHANGQGYYITGSGTRFISSTVPAVGRPSSSSGISTWVRASAQQAFGGGAPNGYYLWSGVMTCLVVDMDKYL